MGYHGMVDSPAYNAERDGGVQRHQCIRHC